MALGGILSDNLNQGGRPRKTAGTAHCIANRDPAQSDPAPGQSLPSMQSLMRKLWLVFAQTTTVCLGILLVVSTLRPDLLEWNKQPGLETVPPAREIPAAAPGPKMTSFSDAARKALPSVVSVFTSKDVKQQRHPLIDDPALRAKLAAAGHLMAKERLSLASAVHRR